MSLRSSGLLLLLDERAILVGRAEIYIDAPDPLAVEAEEFGVAKALAVFCHHLVGNERLISLDEDFFQRLPFDPVGDAPAASEIGPLVDAVVIRAGEGEILG